MDQALEHGGWGGIPFETTTMCTSALLHVCMWMIHIPGTRRVQKRMSVSLKVEIWREIKLSIVTLERTQTRFSGSHLQSQDWKSETRR